MQRRLAHPKLTGRRVVDPGDQIQQSGLSRTRWTHQRKKLARIDFQIQGVKWRDGALSLVVGFRNPETTDVRLVFHSFQSF